MKVKIAVSDLCEAVESALAWFGSLDCDGILMGKIVSSRTIGRKLKRALKRTYRECGYAAVVREDRIDSKIARERLNSLREKK